jgi:twinkle protein
MRQIRQLQSNVLGAYICYEIDTDTEIDPNLFPSKDFRKIAHTLQYDHGYREVVLKKEQLWSTFQNLKGYGETHTKPGSFEDHYNLMRKEFGFGLTNKEMSVYTAKDIKDDIDTLYEKGLPPGLSTGWSRLDEHFTLEKGQLVVVTGVPNSGKSEFVDALMVNAINQHKWSAFWYSAENQPIQLHFEKLLSKISKKPFGEGWEGRMSQEVKDAYIEALSKKVYLSKVAKEMPTVDTMLHRISSVRDNVDGLDCAIIDPWNSLIHKVSGGDSYTKYIQETLRRIGTFASHEDIMIIVVAHPTKISMVDEKDQTKGHRVVTPYDISDSHGWYDAADFILSVWRNPYKPKLPVQIHTQKVRHKHLGETGTVELDYQNSTGIYTERSW